MPQAILYTLADAARPAPAPAIAVTRVAQYSLPLKHIPVDFFADPDGDWDWETLVTAAGFDDARHNIAIGALASEFRGHPAGSAVITLNSKSRPYVAIIECPPLADSEPGDTAIGRILGDDRNQVA